MLQELQLHSLVYNVQQLQVLLFFSVIMVNLYRLGMILSLAKTLDILQSSRLWLTIHIS